MKRILVVLLVFSALIISCAKKEITSKEYLEKLKGKSVDQIYQMKKKETKQALIKEIIVLSKEIKQGEEIGLIPHIAALIEKHKEFKDSEIIKLLRDKNLPYVLKEPLVFMYVKIGGSKEKIKPLLKSEDLDKNLKELLMNELNLKNNINIKEEKMNQNLMRLLLKQNKKEAYEYVFENYPMFQKLDEDEKLALLLGIRKYYAENPKGDDKKTSIIRMLNELVDENYKKEKDRSLIISEIFKTYSSLNDFNTTKYIFSSEKFSKEDKLTALMNGAKTIIERLELGVSSDDLKFIIKAMKVYPIKQVAVKLKGLKGEKTKEIKDIIDYIMKHGIEVKIH